MKKECKNCVRWYPNGGWIRSFSLKCSGENPNYKCKSFSSLNKSVINPVNSDKP